MARCLCRILGFFWVLLVAYTSADAAPKVLRGVRFGQQGPYTRIVFDVPQATAYQVEPGEESRRFRIVFPAANLSQDTRVFRAASPLVQEVRLVSGTNQLIGEIVLKQPGVIHQHFLMRTPARLVVDFAPRPATPPVPPSPQETQAVPPAQMPHLHGRAAPSISTAPPSPPTPSTPAGAPLSPSPAVVTPVRRPSGGPPPTQLEPIPASMPPGQLLERAERHWAAQHYEAALQAYTVFLQRYPTHPHHHLIATRVADILRERQRHREALEAYANVVDTYPGSEGAMISQLRMAELGTSTPNLLPDSGGQRYAFYHHPMAALQNFMKDYPHSPLVDVARFKIGDILQQRQDLPAALEAFEQLLRHPLQETLRREVQASLRQALATLLATRQHQGAFFQVLQTYFTHKPYLAPDDAGHADILFPVALSYTHLGLHEEAESLLKTLSQTAPTPQQRLSATLAYATMLSQRGETQAATALLTPPEQFADAAMHRQALLMLTSHALQEGQLTAALAYGHAIDALPQPFTPVERATLFARVGQAYAVQGNADKAVDVFHQCAEVSAEPRHKALGPIVESCLLRAAAIRLAQERYPQALALYERALQALPTSRHNEWITFRMAELHRRLADEPARLATLTQLRDRTQEAFWHKVATEHLDDATWQQQFHERLATLQNAFMW